MIYDGTIWEELTVDVSRQNEFTPPLVKQKDSYTRGYIITLTNNGEVLSVSQENTTVWFNCRNQSDETKRASATCTINQDGTISARVPTVVMEAAGMIQCDISIITSSDNDAHILKSTLFYLNCQEAANPDGSSSMAEDSILAAIVAGAILPPGAKSDVMSMVLHSSGWDTSTMTYQIYVDDRYPLFSSNTKVDIDIDATAYAALVAAGCGGLYVENNDGTLLIHAIDAVPTSNITVQLTLSEVTSI